MNKIIELVKHAPALPLRQEVEHLLGRGKRPVGGEEDIDVGGLQLPRVAGQGLDQALEGARLEEADSHRLPLQVGDWVLIV